MTETLRTAIEASIRKQKNPKLATDEVLNTLHEMKLIAFSGEDVPSLLTVNGRVLAFLSEFPKMSLREIASRTGSTESSVSRAVSNLVAGKLVKRKKVKGVNLFTVDKEKLASHPDMRRLYFAAVSLFD